MNISLTVEEHQSFVVSGGNSSFHCVGSCDNIIILNRIYINKSMLLPEHVRVLTFACLYAFILASDIVFPIETASIQKLCFCLCLFLAFSILSLTQTSTLEGNLRGENALENGTVLESGFGFAILVSLVNIMASNWILNTGGNYYIFVYDALSLFTVCTLVSIWVLFFECYADTNVSSDGLFTKSAIHVIYLGIHAINWICWIYFGVLSNIIAFRTRKTLARDKNGGIASDILGSSGINERNWHVWSSDQVLTWLSRKVNLSRNILRRLQLHSLTGEMLHLISINDVQNMVGYSHGDAFRIHVAIRRLVEENDGGYVRREEIRNARYKNFDGTNSQLYENSSFLENNVTQTKVGASGVEMAKVQEVADKFMKEKYGIVLPTLRGMNDESHQTEIQTNEVSKRSGLLQTGTGVTLTEPNHNDVEFPIINEKMSSVIEAMPPHIRSIAERNPDAVAKLLTKADSKSTPLSIQRKTDESTLLKTEPDEGNNSKSLRPNENRSPLYDEDIESCPTGDENQHLLGTYTQRDNPLRRRTRKR